MRGSFLGRFLTPANQLGGLKNVWNLREYGVCEPWVTRESTVCPTSTLAHPMSRQSLIITKFGWTSVTLRDDLKNRTLSILHIFLTEKRAIEQN